jgi:hypothetical protein
MVYIECDNTAYNRKKTHGDEQFMSAVLMGRKITLFRIVIL